MNGFNKCDNGHFFKDSLSHCPYCTDATSTISSGNGQPIDLNKTIVGTGNTPQTEIKTEHYGDSDKTKVFGGNAAQIPSQQDLNKTFIGGVVHSSEDKGNPIASPNTPRASRKIVAWIISYTLDEMGVDYRIYEGNNTIGREPVNSIIIAKDQTVSGKHANILNKGGKFWIRDEMAANGTFLNEEELEPSKAYELNDNDVIKIANTVFKFKTAH